MAVTDLFGPEIRQRKAIRSEPNPLDKSTIVSIYPKEVDEKKWTIQPGRFIIPKGSIENPSLIVIGSSSWWRDFDPGQPLVEIPQSSISVADAVVTDYCNGLLGYVKSDSQPGLFWVPGEFTSIIDLKKADFSRLFGLGITGQTLFDRAVLYQENYWKRLIKIADIGWAKTNGSPYVINDDMRTAAEHLGFKDKAWMKDMQMLAQVNCPMCGTPRNPNYPMCANCKAVLDPEKAKALGIQFAK
jgi:hypothetical protein